MTGADLCISHRSVTQGLYPLTSRVCAATSHLRPRPDLLAGRRQGREGIGRGAKPRRVLER